MLLPRLVYWWGGFFVIAGLLSLQTDAAPTSSVIAGFFGWLIAGIVIELAAWARSRRRYQLMLDHRPLRPADGRAEVLPMPDLEIRTNSIDRRFGRLVALPSDDLDWTRDHGDGVVIGVPHPRPLVGRVALASLFLGRDGREWNDAEIAQTHKFLWRGAEWMEREARAWDAAVNVALCQAYLVGIAPDTRDAAELLIANEEHRVGLYDRDETQRVVAAVRRVIQEQLGVDAEALVARLARRLDADHLVWIVHSLSAGRSHWVDEKTSGIRDMTIAVCYAREEEQPGPWPDAPFPDPITFVHEMLHAFGASDKYGTSAARFALGDVTERDIMLLRRESLSQLRIDAMTAREIGWARGKAPVRARREP